MKNFAIWILAAFLPCTLSSQVLLTHKYLGQRSKSQLDAQFGVSFFKNGVRLYKVTYSTPDLQGNPSVASGLIVVPDDPSKIYPLLCYQHGTASSENEIPSNLNFESNLPISLAGMGYLAVAPDYLGLGESPGFHPYVHAESEASVAVDLLRAAKEFAALKSIYFNDQLFITGYSQGGHAAMALHRKIELELSDEFTVSASAPMSGPYSVGEIMRDLVLSEQTYLYPSYIPNTILSYQLVYGNIYNELPEVFKPEYAGLVSDYRNGQIPLYELNAQLVSKLQQVEGASIPIRMIQPAFLQAVMTDPDHPFNVALKENNVYDWAPAAPTRLFYCMADDQVPFRNTILADSIMDANGAPDVEFFDVSPTSTHGQCVFPATINTIFFFGTIQELGDSVTATKQVVVEGLDVFPNPAKEMVFINNLSESGDLQLFDMSGRQLLSRPVEKGDQEVPLGILPDGMYILKVTGHDKIWINKLMVRRE